jgi:predicted glycoside hydrolase/deacetylase ChbG (UPF0249 family)
MKQLIITADDFGITKSVNEGIARAYREGAITCVSFLPSGDAYQDAVARAGALGIKEMAAHLALTEVSPVSDPAKVSSLVTKSGRFNKSRISFFLKFFLGSIKTEEIYSELKAQLDLLKKAGIPIACLSGHEHIHMMPGILEIFIKLAKEYDIPSIRYMNDNSKIAGFDLAKIFRAMVQYLYRDNMKKSFGASSIKYADRLLGFIDSGRMGEKKLMMMLGGLPDGVTELVTHPGLMGPEIASRYKFHSNCERELKALTSPSVRSLISKNNITLTTFGSL